MIALDLQTFRQRRKGDNVTGVIFLELEGGAFPEPGWRDFPVVIIAWWIDAWLQLCVPTRREVQWRFMDGPYAATLTKVPGGGLNSSRIYASLLAAAEGVVAHCEKNQMTNRDLDLLRDHVDRFKANPCRAKDSEFPIQVAAKLIRSQV